MSGKQAKIVSIQQIEDLLVFAAQTRCPARNLVLVLLSVRAGLRAGESANLTWEMVLDPTGAVGSIIELRDWAAKKNSGRTIPLHPDLVAALVTWRHLTDGRGPIVRSERGGPMTAVSIVNWFATAYRTIGVDGCSPSMPACMDRGRGMSICCGGKLRQLMMRQTPVTVQTPTIRSPTMKNDARR